MFATQTHIQINVCACLFALFMVFVYVCIYIALFHYTAQHNALFEWMKLWTYVRTTTNKHHWCWWRQCHKKKQNQFLLRSYWQKWQKNCSLFGFLDVEFFLFIDLVGWMFLWRLFSLDLVPMLFFRWTMTKRIVIAQQNQNTLQIVRI